MIRKARVLVIDDSDLGGRTLVTVLTSAGYEVRWETTAALGIDAAGAWEPDAVLLDRRLPDADGVTVVAKLRAAVPGGRVRIVLLSGDPAEEAGGIDCWLTKPVPNRVLLDALIAPGQP